MPLWKGLIMSRLARLAPAALLLLVWASAAHAAEYYEIKLTRPLNIGDKQRTVGTSTAESIKSVAVGEKASPPERTQSVTTFDLTSQVLKVDEKGRVVSEEYTVEKLTRKDAAGEKEILKKGSVVTATTEKGQVGYQLKDGQMTPQIRQALAEAVSLFSGGPDDDETFGTGIKQKPGESWPINPQAVAESIGRKGLTVDAADVLGRVTLTETKTVGAIPALEIVTLVAVKKLRPPAGVLPPGVRIDQSTLAIRAAGTFPVDVALQPLASKVSTEMITTLIGKVGAATAETKVTTTDRNVRQVTVTAIK